MSSILSVSLVVGRAPVAGPSRQLKEVVTISCDLIANLDVVRVTRVDSCGAPVTGETNAFVSECVASVALNPNVDVPDDVIYRAANGSLCGVKRGCPTLLGYDLEFNFYQVSPQMVDILTNQPMVVDAEGEPVGFDDCSVNCSGGFALEFWAELIGEGACTEDGTPKYLYVLIPWVSNAYISDLEIGSEQVTFQLVGNSKAGGRWGVGPWDVVQDTEGAASPMLTPLGATCHRRMQIVTVAPPVPDPDCDYTPVPTPAPPAGGEG
jgi:hypothetical protein